MRAYLWLGLALVSGFMVCESGADWGYLVGRLVPRTLEDFKGIGIGTSAAVGLLFLNSTVLRARGKA